MQPQKVAELIWDVRVSFIIIGADTESLACETICWAPLSPFMDKGLAMSYGSSDLFQLIPIESFWSVGVFLMTHYWMPTGYQLLPEWFAIQPPRW